MEKAYVDENNKITLRCPRCGQSKVIDVTHILEKKKKGLIKVSYKFKCTACKCGHIDCNTCNSKDCSHGNTNIFQLERRKFYRKSVDLEGIMNCGEIKSHQIKVHNLSRTGLQFETKVKDVVKRDNICQLEFTLDDSKKTIVKKEILVKWADENLVDGAFTDNQTFDNNDKAIGFYLLK